MINIEVIGERAVLTIDRTLDPLVTDKNNPSRDKRSRRLRGIILGSGFTHQENSWQGGELYDPVSGKRYKSSIERLDENHLQIRGYIGLPVLGRSQVWQRFSFFRNRMVTMLDIMTSGDQHD